MPFLLRCLCPERAGPVGTRLLFLVMLLESKSRKVLQQKGASMRYQFADKTWDSERVFAALVTYYGLTDMSPEILVQKVIEHAWDSYYGAGRKHCDTSRQTMRLCVEEYTTNKVLPYFLNREVHDLCEQGKISLQELEPLACVA